MKSMYTTDMLGTPGYKYPTEEEIIEKTAVANRLDLDFAKEKGKYLGYKESLAMTTSELFKPITNVDKMKTGTEALETTAANIRADPNIPVPQKLEMIKKLEEVKLDKFTTAPKKSPEQQRREEANGIFKLQNDELLGLGLANDFYCFGVIELFSEAKCLSYIVEDVTKHHRVIIDYAAGKINVAKPRIINKGSAVAYAGAGEPEVNEYNYSIDLLVLLTSNTTDGISSAREAYMNIVDFCIGDEFAKLKTSLQRIQRDGVNTKSVERNQLDLLERLRGNVKFVNWISVKYGIPLRIQADRATKSGVRYESPDTSFKSPDDSDDEWNPGTGRGIRLVAISPHSDERVKRLAVLLGHKRSTKDNDPDALAEFTGILDSLLKEEKVPINVYKRFMKMWQNNSK